MSNWQSHYRARNAFSTGAILVLDESRAIIVRSETERWLRLEPRSIADAIELGYQAGNLHWRVCGLTATFCWSRWKAGRKTTPPGSGNWFRAGRVKMSIFQEAGAGEFASRHGHDHVGHHHHHGSGRRLNLLPLLHTIWQADGTFPSGAFAFSYGVEGTAALGRVSDKPSLLSLVATILRFRWATFDRVALLQAFRSATDLSQVARIDHDVEAGTFGGIDALGITKERRLVSGFA